jgi:uncharacterized Zn finger protein
VKEKDGTTEGHFIRNSVCRTEVRIDRDYFADKLKRDFPEEIGEYFAQLALRHVEGGAGPNRKGYIQAVNYYRKVKEIYAQILKDKRRWERLLTDMKERYKKIVIRVM